MTFNKLIRIKDLIKHVKRVILSAVSNKKVGASNDELIVVSNSVVFRLNNKLMCGKKLLLVKGFASSISEVGSKEAPYVLKTYYNVLNLGFPVEIRTYIMPLDKGSFINRIDKNIDELNLVLEINPSSTNVKRKLDKLRRLRDLAVNDGLSPYDVIAIFAVEACDEDLDGVIKKLSIRSKVLRDSLHSVGIKAEEINIHDTNDLIKLFFRFSSTSRGFSKVKEILVRSRYVVNVLGYHFFTLVPFLISSATQYLLRYKGVYLGRNIDTNELVYWDLKSSMSPHVLVIGPTGSGKTEFLSLLIFRIVDTYGVPAVVFDVKGEYSERLSKWGCRFYEYVIGNNAGLGIGKLLTYVPRKFRANWLTDVLSTVFTYEPLSKEVTSAFYRAANEVLNSISSISDFNEVLNQILSYVSSFEDPYVSYRIAKVVKLISSLDQGPSIIDSVLSRGNCVYVINLTDVLSLGINYVSLVSNILIKTMEIYLSRIGKPARIPNLTLLLVFDEGWALLRPSNAVSEIIRLGRSYGVVTALASQRISDVASKDPSIISNIGLLVAMPSPDREYWQELSDYMSLHDELIKRFSTTLSRGETVIRISPDPRPIALKFY